MYVLNVVYCINQTSTMYKQNHSDGTFLEMLSEKPFKFAHKKGEPLSKARIAIQENTEQLLLKRQYKEYDFFNYAEGNPSWWFSYRYAIGETIETIKTGNHLKGQSHEIGEAVDGVIGKF
jgi:hypothetical protein